MNVFINWGDAEIGAGNHPARMWLHEGLQWGGTISSQSDICSSHSIRPKKSLPKFLVPSYQVDQLGDEPGGRSLKHQHYISATYLGPKPKHSVLGGTPIKYGLSFHHAGHRWCISDQLGFYDREDCSSWKDIGTSSPYKILNLWWSIQRPKLCPELVIMAS